MYRTCLSGLFAFSLCAAVAAAQAQTPTPAPTPAPAPQAAAKAANSISVEGCVQRSASASSSTPGATGTSGAAGYFVLSNAMKPMGTAGSASASSAPAVATSYRLEADDAKLTPHVGHKVEITGTVAATTPASPESATAGAAAAAPQPRLTVESVKMLAASCS